jgi:branched-chain amino acid transport system substrate-binding protein
MRLKHTLVAAIAVMALAGQAYANEISIKIGVMNDRSGLYADLTGEGSVVAARMAAEDFGVQDRLP